MLERYRTNYYFKLIFFSHNSKDIFMTIFFSLISNTISNTIAQNCLYLIISFGQWQNNLHSSNLCSLQLSFFLIFEQWQWSTESLAFISYRDSLYFSIWCFALFHLYPHRKNFIQPMIKLYFLFPLHIKWIWNYYWKVTLKIKKKKKWRKREWKYNPFKINHCKK